jgi:hypothetical protein
VALRTKLGSLQPRSILAGCWFGELIRKTDGAIVFGVPDKHRTTSEDISSKSQFLPTTWHGAKFLFLSYLQEHLASIVNHFHWCPDISPVEAK